MEVNVPIEGCQTFSYIQESHLSIIILPRWIPALIRKLEDFSLNIKIPKMVSFIEFYNLLFN